MECITDVRIRSCCEDKAVPPAGGNIGHLGTSRHCHRLRGASAGKLAGAQLPESSPAKGKCVAAGRQHQGVACASCHLGHALIGQGSVLHKLGLRQGSARKGT